MSFSFDPGLTDPLDRVRQLIGDTVDAEHLVEDATITYYLTIMGELATAARLAHDLMARFASSIDAGSDRQLFQRSQRFKQYKELAINLDAQLAQQGSTGPGEDTNTATTDFAGVGAFGTTSQEVLAARCNPDLAMNTPSVFETGISYGRPVR